MRRLSEQLEGSRQEQALMEELAREDIRFHIAIMTAGKNDLMKKEILRLHLINRVVAPEALADEAWELASRLAQGPTLAFGELKNLLIASATETLESQLENEARAMARVTRTEDAWNAMQAVLAKQKATFKGR